MKTIILFLLPITIHGQQTNWKTFAVNNTGYPYRTPNDLLLDANSNIRIGGTFGLTEFDGIHRLNKNQSNPDTPFRWITNIFERNGKLYTEFN